MNTVIKIFFLFLLLTGATSFKKPSPSTKIFITAFSPLIKATLNVNGTKVNLKGNSYAEFEVTGDMVNCSLDIKLPVAGVNPDSLTLEGGGEIYLAIYLKKSKLFKAVFAMECVSESNYYELKKKCKKEANVF